MNKTDIVEFLRTQNNMNTIEEMFSRHLIVQNWNEDLQGVLDDEILLKYTRRLEYLFLKDENHLSIHDLAWAICECGEYQPDSVIYDYAIGARY
jgi:hypothetical protein